jgi:hypothetical protein
MKARKILFLLFFMTLLANFSILVLRKNQQVEQKKEVYQSIPDFHLADITGKIITKSSLQKNKSALFLAFNPDCDLCREELNQIKLNQEAFSPFQIVFFSPASAEEIKNLLNEIDFVPSPSMFFLIDEQEILTDKIELKMFPTSCIYNAQGNLIKRFDGQVKVETLLKYLSE